MGMKFGTEEGSFGPLIRAKFHPNRCNVSPLRDEKPQNRPLSKVNTGSLPSRNAAGKETAAVKYTVFHKNVAVHL